MTMPNTETGMTKTLLIATHNHGKLREFELLFADLPLQIISLDDVGIQWDVDETGRTFEENARLKAQAYCDATHLLTLADDSGLEVDALGGEPGVLSARYGGAEFTPQQQYELVLGRMKAVPYERRQARFRCVIAIARPDRPVLMAEGTIEGEIAYEARGEGGFGYDPIFYVPSCGMTTAQLSKEEKNRISHRGLAAQAAKKILEQIISEA
jgi:XTP/dITP diphosphohydrolase